MALNEAWGRQLALEKLERAELEGQGLGCWTRSLPPPPGSGIRTVTSSHEGHVSAGTVGRKQTGRVNWAPQSPVGVLGQGGRAEAGGGDREWLPENPRWEACVGCICSEPVLARLCPRLARPDRPALGRPEVPTQHCRLGHRPHPLAPVEGRRPLVPSVSTLADTWLNVTVRDGAPPP